MSLKSQPNSLIPADTLRVAKAVFVKGNPYLTLHDELGSIFEDADFTELLSSVTCRGLIPTFGDRLEGLFGGGLGS